MGSWDRSPGERVPIVVIRVTGNGIQDIRYKVQVFPIVLSRA